MRLTKQAEIAVHILALCARSRSGPPVTTRTAAGFADTTKAHAAQIVAKLVRHRYLESERGRNGGIRLAYPASHIGVGEVIRLMEPSFDDTPDEGSPFLAFDALLHAAVDSFMATFDSFTIADLAGDPKISRIGCLDCSVHTVVRHGRALAGFRPDRTASIPM